MFSYGLLPFEYGVHVFALPSFVNTIFGGVLRSQLRWSVAVSSTLLSMPLDVWISRDRRFHEYTLPLGRPINLEAGVS